MSSPIGIIAGQGRLPILTAQGIRAAGFKVACIGLRDQFTPDLPQYCDFFQTASITHLGRWIRLFHRWNVHQAVMVGRVRKTRMYDPFKWLHYIPDWRAAKIWYFRLRHDRRTDKLLSAVADELLSQGITLMDSTTYIPQSLAQTGPLTSTKPSSSVLADIAFGLPIVRRLGDLDIGQAIAVKDREVIAVEAIEGTDAMIRRAGELCPTGGWTLIKLAKPNQDMRFDVPTVGLQTIQNLHAAGACCLAVEAGKTILLDTQDMISVAEKHKISLIGVRDSV